MEFSSPATVGIAVNLAVITFNSGMKGLSPLLERLDAQPGPLTMQFLSSRDTTRVRKAARKEEEVSKRRRKSLRAQKKSVEEQRVEQEGVTWWTLTVSSIFGPVCTLRLVFSKCVFLTFQQSYLLVLYFCYHFKAHVMLYDMSGSVFCVVSLFCCYCDAIVSAHAYMADLPLVDYIFLLPYG